MASSGGSGVKSKAEVMQTFDVKRDQGTLSQLELLSLKKLEELNRQRVERLVRQRRSNRWFGGFLGLVVISIYTYSITAVKQETFLDDFDHPDKNLQHDQVNIQGFTGDKGKPDNE